MDEPTAALGVVQTGNVLDVIRRVRDRGRRGGPDQPQHARGARGRRPDRGAATRPARREVRACRGDARGAGRRDDRSARAPGTAMSTQSMRPDEPAQTSGSEPPETGPRPGGDRPRPSAGADLHVDQPGLDLPRADRDRRRVRRHEAEPVPVELRHQDDFHRRGGGADAVGRDDLRDHHRGHRSVGRLGAGDRGRTRRQGDDRHRRRRLACHERGLGPDPAGLPRRPAGRRRMGRVQRSADRAAGHPPADRHARQLRDGARPRRRDHRWRRHLRDPVEVRHRRSAAARSDRFRGWS